MVDHPSGPRAPRRRATSRLAATATVIVALGAGACAGGSTEPAPIAPPPTVDTTPRWATVDSIVTATANAGILDDFVVAIWDAGDSLVYLRTVGDFDVDRRVAVASASKLIAGLVLLDVVADGALSLESTTGDVLGWTDAKGAITLRHLLSFTSGMVAEHPCVLDPFRTLASCVALIEQVPPVAAAGVRYDYGNTHLHVAARMAEVVTGRTWNTLVRERLADPLGFPEGVRYVTLPQQNIGTSNPLVAGGLWASTREYGRMLRLLFHDGTRDNISIANASLIAAMSREPFPQVVVGASPYAEFGMPEVRYGLTAWLECTTPATGCARFSSPGAFGFTPWIDRDGRYYGIIGMQQGLLDRAARDGVTLAYAIGPAIRRALGTD